MAADRRGDPAVGFYHSGVGLAPWEAAVSRELSAGGDLGCALAFDLEAGSIPGPPNAGEPLAWGRSSIG